MYEPASECSSIVLLEHVLIVDVLEHDDGGRQLVVHVAVRARALAQQRVAVPRQQLGRSRGPVRRQAGVYYRAAGLTTEGYEKISFYYFYSFTTENLCSVHYSLPETLPLNDGETSA